MPSFTLLGKKKKAPPKDFDWINDPADSLRGKARISKADAQGMVDYNQRLVSPIDRPSDRGGEGSYFRVNGQPERLATAPEQPVFPAGTFSRGWQQPDQAGMARIRSQYGGAPENPNLTQPPVTTRMAPTGTPSSPIPAGGIIDTGVAGANAAGTGAGIPFQQSNQALAGAETPPADYRSPVPTVEEPPNPNLNDWLHSLADNPNVAPGAGGPVGSPGQPGPVVNPATGAPVVTAQQQEAQRHALWLALGGSDHTYHEAQVAQGVRPAIDGRSKPDPLASHTSADIRAGWGWGATPEENAAQIHDQMTSEFNQNNAAVQGARRKLFSDAHQKLMDTLNAN